MKTTFARFLTAIAAPAVFIYSLSACVDNHERSISMARTEIAEGNAGAAVVRLRGLLQSEPGYREARVLLGQILLDSGNASGAERELRKALEIGADQETVKPLLARALLESGSDKKVLSEFVAQQLRTPEAKADILVSQAYAHLLQGNVETAKRVVQQAAEFSPHLVRLAIVRAVISAAEKDHEAALSAIDKVLARQPNSVEALRAKANIALNVGNREQAISALQALTLAMPSDVAAQYAASVLLWQAGRITDAKIQAERLRVAAPSHPRMAHLDALLALHERDLRAAREHVGLALKGDPGFLPTTLLAANIHAELGEAELAEKELNAVLSKEPNNVPARRALLALQLKTQRKEMALKTARELLERAPEDSAVLKLAAAAHLQAGDAKTSQALFEKAGALGAPDARVLMGLGLARMATGETEQGVNALLQASAADDSSVTKKGVAKVHLETLGLANADGSCAGAPGVSVWAKIRGLFARLF
jgi:putative PEP-CTERM system TPR-repeat lipoprotein